MKLLTLLTIPTLALSSISFSLVGCGNDKPVPPGPGPTPPGPSTDFNVTLDSDADITLSNTKAVLNSAYNTQIILSDNTRSIQTITVNNGNKNLLLNSEFTWSNNQLHVNGDQITTKYLLISITTMLIEPISTETPEQYIKNRTFSIEAYAEYKDAPDYYSVVSGTAWIIDDATPLNNEDYKYYVATNWHVTHGFDSLLDTDIYEDVTYAYADDSMNIAPTYPMIYWGSYNTFKSYKQLSKSNFLYTSQDSENPTNWFKPCIDLYVCEVDFSNDEMTAQTKTKLDFLNELKSQKGCINRFANADNETIKSKNKIIGGYPGTNMTIREYEISGAKWEMHDSLNGSSFTYLNRSEMKPYIEDHQVVGHSIGEPDKDQQGQDIEYTDPDVSPEEFYYYDIAPQATYASQPTTWMDHGASGSMLITEDCEVCGIYWGGLSNGFYLTPCFSLFKSNDKDFTLNWCK